MKAPSRRIAAILLAACSIAALLSCNLPSSWQKDPTTQADYTVSIVEGDKTIDNGAKQTFSSKLSVSSLSGATYAWYVNGTKQDAATSSTFSFSATPKAETVYTVKVVVSAGGTSKEASVKCTVKAPAFSVSISEGDKTIDYGSPQTFTAKAVNVPEGKTAAYSWYVDDVEQLGCVKGTFVFSAMPSARNVYTVKVKASAGDISAEASVTCTVQAPGAVSKDEAAKAYVVFESIFSTAMPAAMGSGTLPATLKIEERTDKTGSRITATNYLDTLCQTGYTASGWVDVNTEDYGSSFNFSFYLSLSDGAVKKVSSEGLKGPLGGPYEGSVVADGTSFKYSDLVPPSATISVSIKEGSQTVDNDTTATFTALSSGVPDGTNISYAWYVDDVLQSGTTTGNFSFSAKPSYQTTYSIKVIATAGSASAEASATCTVRAPALAVTIKEGTLTIDNGEKATFTALPSSLPDGTNVSYAWYIDDVLQSGTTTGNFSFSAKPSSQTTYSIKVIATAGGASAEASATCTVRAPALAVTIKEGTLTIDNGEKATFTALPSGVPDGTNVSYAWYVDDVLQSGTTTGNFSFSARPSSQTTYRIKVIATAGSASAQASATCSVKAPAAIPCYVKTSTDLQNWTAYASSTAFTVAGGVVLNDGLLLREGSSRKYYSYVSGSWVDTGIVAPEGARLDATLGGSKFLCLVQGNEIWRYDESSAGDKWEKVTASGNPLFDPSATIIGFGKFKDASTDKFWYVDSNDKYFLVNADGTNPSTNAITLPSGTIQAFIGGSGVFCLNKDGNLKGIDTSGTIQASYPVPTGTFALVPSMQNTFYTLYTQP
jgi:hypothetical protein